MVERNGFRPRTWVYEWDGEDHLIQRKDPNGTYWHYGYDPFGRRIFKEHFAQAANDDGRPLDIDPAMGKSIDDDTLMIAIDAFFGAVRGLAQKNIDKDTEKSIRIKLLDILLITFSDSDEQ